MVRKVYITINFKDSDVLYAPSDNKPQFSLPFK